LIHHATAFKIDVFIPRNRPFEESQFARRVRHAPVEDVPQPLVFASPEDVILTKLEWYQAGHEIAVRQWDDLIGVLTVQGDRLDLSYLRRWAAALGVADLLDRALRESGQSAG
jgi:hypothetical protein